MNPNPYCPTFTRIAAWWDPDEVRRREEDAMMTDEDRQRIYRAFMLAPLLAIGAFGVEPRHDCPSCRAQAVRDFQRRKESKR